MNLLHNNNWQASIMLRGLMTIVFILWLVSVLHQYVDNNSTQIPEVTIKQAASSIVIEQLMLPPVPKPKVKSQGITKLANQSAVTVTKRVQQSSQSLPVNTQQVEQVYQKLSDEGVDIQIAWPRFTDKRQAALRFMYQCVGMQFAVLNGNTLNKVNHTKGKKSELTEYSDWIRVAQGSLSKKEHNWLNAYALTGTPIRLFPREIDWRLAQYITKALNGAPLTHFRASYQLSNQQLQLIDISINNQKLTNNWMLYQGTC